MKRGFRFLIKVFGVGLSLCVGQALGGLIGQTIVHPKVPSMIVDGGLSLAQAMGLVTVIFAILLSLMASQMRGGFWRMAFSLFALLYGLETVLSMIEAVYFNAYLKLDLAILALVSVSNLIKSVLAALTCAALWRNGGADQPPIKWLYLKLGLIIPIYIVFYFGAGALIAWQGAAVRAYYGQGMHINVGELALLQVGRGLIWGALAWVSVTALTGSKAKRALLTGLAFAIFMSLTLLYPSSFMPWAVRKSHLVEICASNFLFGIVAVLILMAGVKASPEVADHP